MEITVEHKTSTAVGPFGPAAARLSMSMEGRKQWLSPSRLRFETSGHNLEVLLSLFPEAVLIDKRIDASLIEEATEGSPESPAPALGFKMEPMPFQRENFERFKDKNAFAIFSEQGTGKTKVALDIVSWRWHRCTVTGLLVLSSPKGVHAQWVENQLPKHLWDSVPALTYTWEGKKPPEWLSKATEELQIISGNIDMVKSRRGHDLLEAFARQHRDRLMVIIDESDSIANINSQRSKRLRSLVCMTRQRAIMTGTPIAKDLTDEWAQFYFLDPAIIGHKYLTSFRAQYCIMGGWENKSVIGHQNLERFKELTSPHIFRATKKELALPPKVYDEVVFDLSDEQRRLIRELRDQFWASLPMGDAVAVKTGAVALLRIQQISNGFAVDESEKVHRIGSNPRLEALLDLRRNISGPVIVWCRFKEDVRLLASSFPGAVTIFGENSQQERLISKEKFLSGEARELIATPAAAGRGLDGLQAICQDAIYYSNSFNAIDRWQSEDRIHRIGMAGTATYFDLVARGSIDRAIMRNLKQKKDLSTSVLDDIKQIMESVT